LDKIGITTTKKINLSEPQPQNKEVKQMESIERWHSHES
jgi:hypothetical protein